MFSSSIKCPVLIYLTMSPFSFFIAAIVQSTQKPSPLFFLFLKTALKGFPFLIAVQQCSNN